MSWTQPLCDHCWRGDGKNPVRLAIPEPETCCQCGQPTESGIYIRIDPKTVPYPSDD